MINNYFEFIIREKFAIVIIGIGGFIVLKF